MDTFVLFLFFLFLIHFFFVFEILTYRTFWSKTPTPIEYFGLNFSDLSIFDFNMVYKRFSRFGFVFVINEKQNPNSFEKWEKKTK